MTLSDVLLNNINKNFVANLDSKEIELIEKNKKYSIKIRGLDNTSSNILIQNLEELKQKYLPYTSGKYMPKDCDYILIREKKKEIIFIELKSESDKCFRRRHSEIVLQLLSGNTWLNHLAFCSTDHPNLVDTYTKKFIAINKKTKTFQKCLPELTIDRDGARFTFWNGMSFNINELTK
ncbi:hypothetical protein ACYKKI_08920 [Streptococcus suis]|uniref:hypothetical protein n=2 Tax=Streptococcus suis TaxID=1307 RepID=UPI0004A2DE2E|nr:hypothetical protein [Streptococcus suis]MBS8026470.1 hypothetical protein [Streptococcus suis]MCK4022678.1 hypothetical protein [Streptococcus suis]MCQ9277436.1 hypothetical protein [Streptococcus suis]MCQ9286984.1 hypothetical protein [Streptococcus suis]HEL1622053.1 hypothetical protein [Streptococcus suis]